MILVPNITIFNKIYESANSLVYRGIRETDKLPLILKLLKQSYPTATQYRYQQEYAITHSLNLEGVIKTYGLQKYQNTLVMLLEDFGGESLKILLSRYSFSLSEFLHIAIRITDILGKIHQANVIHKDINPSNIVFNSVTKKLKIIDFGISSTLSRENATVKNSKVIEGTLAYISPEQTGRMNRDIDYRTDFYSLGVTFYELLTDRLPFESIDPMELVDCHIAKQPLPPHELNPEIPGAVSEIVMNLMAKTPEERYQTTDAIKADLESCLTQLESRTIWTSQTTPNISEKLKITQKLYLKEEEVETLKEAFVPVGYPQDKQICDRAVDRKAEQLLENYNRTLETQVQQRTAELAQANARLVQEIAERKQIEAELRQSKQQLSAILENVGAYIYIKDLDSRFTYVNRSCVELFGLPEEQIIGADDFELFSEEMASSVREVDRQVIESGAVVRSYHVGAANSNGEVRHYLSVKVPLKNPDGSVYSICGISTDITELKQTQESLRQSQELFKPAFETAAIGIALVNTKEQERYRAIVEEQTEFICRFRSDTTILFANRAYCRYFGKRQEELIGNSYKPLIFEADRETAVQQVASIDPENPVKTIENRVVVDGEVRWTQWNVRRLFDDRDRCDEFQAVGRDITERKRAEEELRWKETLLRSMASASPLAFYVVDNRSDNILYFNHRFCQIWGIEHLEAQMQQGQLKNNDIIPDRLRVLADVPAFAESYKPLQSEENRAIVEDEIAFNDGRTIRRFSTQIRDEDDRYFGRLYLFEDITDRKRIEEQLQLADFSIERSSIATAWIDRNGKILRANETACKQRGYSREEMVSKQVWDVDPNFPAEVWPHHWQALQEQKRMTFTTEQQAKDGRIIPVEVTLNYLEFNGREYNFAWSSDITERIQAEAALRESEARFQAFMNNSPTPAWITDTDGDILYASQTYLRTFQLPTDDLVGKTIFDLYSTEIAQKFLDNIQQVARTDRVLETTELAPRRDGTMGEFLVYKFPLSSSSGQVLVGGVAIDITDRKQAEENLRKYERIVAAASDAICLFDRNYTYQFANPAYLHWFDKRYEEVIGHSASEILGTYIFETGIKQGIDLSLTGQIVQHEGWIDYPKLGRRFISVTLAPYLDANRTIIGVVASLRNLTELKQAEKQLELQDIIVKNMAEGICLVKASDGIIVYANPKFERMFGYDSGELDGLHISILNYEDDTIDAEAVYREIARNVDIHGEYSYEVHNVKKDGTPFWCRGTTSRFEHPEHGAIYVAVQEDISDRKLAEEALKESEKKFRAIFDRAFQFVGLLSPEGILLEANQTALDFAGISREQVVGKPFWETKWWTISPGTQAQLKVAIAAAVKGEFIRYEVEVLGQDNRVLTIDFSLRPIFDETGQVTLLISEGRDISDRIQAQAKLQAQQAFLRQVIDVVPSAIFVKDKQGRFLTINKAGADIYASTTEAMIGKSDYDFNSDTVQIEEMLATNREVITTLRPHIIHGQPLKNLQGELNWYQTIINPFIDADGQVKGIIGSATNITDLKRTEEELRNAKEAAEAANLSKSVFLANMSHELRTPLNAILGFSQLMSRESNISKEQQENLKSIRKSGEHLLTLINQVLDLSKIEAGRITLNENNFDLHTLLADVEDMFSLKAKDKGLKLEFHLAPDVPQHIGTDEVKLRQVLINLVSNAIKFTASGTVSVKVKMSNRESRTDTKNSRWSIAFEVADTGVGIAADEFDSLFKPFVQTASGQQVQEGTGLGLTIAYKFICLMGGELTLSSRGKTFNPGTGFCQLNGSTNLATQGTTFNFDIAAKVVGDTEVEKQPIGCRAIALAPNQPQFKMLIVDDNDSNRQVLYKLLKPFGFKLREAVNGSEALEICSSWQPDLIWMDMRMPVMSGMEATKRIKATAQGQKTAIVALTASAWEQQKAAILGAGCDDFVRKPFKEEEIFNAIAKHLGVCFIYEEPTALTNTSSEDSFTLTADDLAALPKDLLTSLDRALLEGDLEEIIGSIDRVRLQNEVLASDLLNLANQYQFEKLLDLIKDVDKL